jgi:hypothetical protein
MEMCGIWRLFRQLLYVESEHTLWQFLVSVPAENVQYNLKIIQSSIHLNVQTLLTRRQLQKK